MPADAASSAIVKILGDGTVEVLAATMDMGQGAYTAYSQMVSEELGIPVEKIKCLYPDTQSHPYDWQTVASRSCWSMGMAVKRAAADVRQDPRPLRRVLAGGTGEHHHRARNREMQKERQGGTLRRTYTERIPMPDGNYKGGPVIGTGSFVPPDVIYPDPETGQSPKSVVHFTVGAVGIDVGGGSRHRSRGSEQGLRGYDGKGHLPRQREGTD